MSTVKILSSFKDLQQVKDKRDDEQKEASQKAHSAALYNRSVVEGLSEAEEVKYAAQHHKHPDHEAAKRAFDAVDNNFDTLRQICVDRAAKRNGAKKPHIKNSVYENRVLSALQPSSGEHYNADAGVINKFRDHMKALWSNNSDYSNDVEETGLFLAKNKLVTAIVSLENVKKIVKEYYGIDKVRNNYDLLTPSRYSSEAANRMDQIRNESDEDDMEDSEAEKERKKKENPYGDPTAKIGSNAIAKKMDQVRKKK